MKKQLFFSRSNLILVHFRIYFKMIFLCTLFWLALNLIIGLVIKSVAKNSFNFATSTSIWYVLKSNSGFLEMDKSISDGSASLYEVIKLLYGSFGFLFFITISIVLITYIFRVELRSNSVSLWLTNSYSRTQIFLSKILFILFAILIINIPGFIAMLSISSKANDYNKSGYMMMFFLKDLFLIVFVLMLTAVYIVLIIHFSDVAYVDLSIIIAITLYTFGVSFFKTMYLGLLNHQNQIKYNWLNYVSLLSLSPEMLQFDSSNISNAPERIVAPFRGDDRINVIARATFVPVNMVTSFIFPILNLTIITGCSVYSLIQYKNKEFNI